MATLRDAINAVTILQVAHWCGIEGLKVGMNKSPFRQVKSGEPFSIFKQGYAYKDHGHEEHQGNSWSFLEQARPNMTKGDRAGVIFSLSGLEPDEGGFNKTEFIARKKEQRKQAYKSRDDEFLKLKNFDPPKPWSASVSERWADGADRVPVKRLAEQRGWPVSWVETMADWDKISFPWLPWADPSYKKARRGLAFKVEAPERLKPGKWNLELFPAGYHQRWIHEQDGKQKKDWQFLPNIPRKFSTDFQKALYAEQNRVTPFPFVLGDLDAPKNIIITEGQWDAATIYGAAGWFNDAAEPSTAVFGLRGAQSVEVFLAFYGKWMSGIKPNVFLLPDNDAAGRKWVEKEENNKILPVPTFAQRLRAWGAKRVIHRSIDPRFGKDFNDYYQARTPEPAAIIDWLHSCGLEF